MVLTDSEEMSREARLLRGQGMDPSRRYWFHRIGFNYRLTNVQAAIGLAQVEQLDRHLEMRQHVGRAYQRLLEAAGEFLETPCPPQHVDHAYWMYTVLLRPGLDRDRIAAAMDHDGIETRPAFYPLHEMPPYRSDPSSYPVAESIGRRGLTLPTHGGLTEDDLERVTSALYKACSAEAATVRG